MRFGFCLSLALLLVGGAAPLFAVAPAVTPHLVKDIDPVSLPESSSPHFFVNVLPGLVLFTADDGQTGDELWRTDGTPGGTFRLTDACPGDCSSEPGFVGRSDKLYFFQVPGASGPGLWATDGTPGGTLFLTSAVQFPGFGTWVAAQKLLYFSADDGVHGIELWRSDGTPAGTFMVADLRSGPTGSSPGHLIEFNGKLFFQADDGRGPSLWVSDGTTQGTRFVQNLAPKPTADPLPFSGVIGRTLVFTGATPSKGLQLWRSDGTAKGTVAFTTSFTPQLGSIPFFDFAINKNHLLFVANTQGPGQQLWVTDGSAKGTRPLTNFHPKKQEMFFNGTFGSRQVFSADDGIHGLEYWMTDGTPHGTVLLKDLCPGPCSGSVGEAIPVGNLLYLVGTDGVHGQEPWVSNGTAAGTHIIADLCQGSCDSKPAAIRPAGSFIYFTADDGTNGRQVWRSDGTAQGTFQLTTGVSLFTFDSDFQGFVLGGALVFAAGDAENGTELWRSDGTPQGTGLLVDLDPADIGGSFPVNLTAIGGKVYFLAKSSGKVGPWTSDGTEAGTMALPVPPQSQFANSRADFAGVPGSVFFGMAAFGDPGNSLWRTDGTGSDPVRLTPEGVSVGAPTLVGNLVFFNGFDSDHGTELWVSDGTAAGTHVAADLQPGSVGSILGDFTAFQGHLYFTALAENSGEVRQLWRSDGTEAGTVLVSDLGSSSLTVHDGRLWFFAQDGDGGSTLRSTDGTLAAIRIEPLLPGAGSVAGGPMFWDGSRLFFFGVATGAGSGLFVWDGAPGSLRILGTIDSDSFFSPSGIVSGGAFYFSGRVGGFQNTLWVSDGAEAGTHQVLDASGMPILDPLSFQTFAGTLYFTNHDSLYQTDGTPAGTNSLIKLSEPGASPPDFFHELVAAGPRLFFRKWDPATGGELWALEAN